MLRSFPGNGKARSEPTPSARYTVPRSESAVGEFPYGEAQAGG